MIARKVNNLVSAYNSTVLVVMMELDRQPRASPASSTYWLCVSKQVIELLCASVVLYVNWDNNSTCLVVW